MGSGKVRLLVLALLIAALLLLFTWRPTESDRPDAPPPDAAFEPELLPLTLPPAAPAPDRTVATDRGRLANPSAADFFRPPEVGVRQIPEREREDAPVWLTGVLTGPNGKPLAG